MDAFGRSTDRPSSRSGDNPSPLQSLAAQPTPSHHLHTPCRLSLGFPGSITMDFTQYYAVATAGAISLVFVLTVAFALTRNVSRWYRHVRRSYRKHVLIFLRRRTSSTIRAAIQATLPGLDGLLLVLFVTANVMCASIGGFASSGPTMTDLAQFGRRMGTIAEVNMAILFGCGRLNPLCDYCGLGYERLAKLHKWIGIVLTVEAVLHCFTSSMGQISEIGQSGKIAGYLVSFC